MRKGRGIILFAALGGTLLLTRPAPARADRDPDWPCVQPFVASLTAATYWGAAPAPPGADWRQDTRIAAIVAAVTPRDVPLPDARARLADFADSIPAGERSAVLAETFQGLVDEVNLERDRLLARLKQMARRQRDLSHMATRLASELHAVPPGTPQAEDLTERRDFSTRAFQEAQRTMRYACEAPAGLEARLGEFARTLQGKLGG